MRFYNTAGRSLEDFNIPTGEEIKLYTCGPTVYDYLHIGNWTAYIRWDTLVRLLTYAGYKVNRVMNITDVGHLVSDADEGEDKLEQGARREGLSAWEIAQKYSNDFFKGMHDLNLLPANHSPRATEHIPEQIALIKNLEDKGFTYKTDDGLYYDTSKFPRYADFAGLNLSGQEAGARIGINPEKRNPSDFALWKFTVDDRKRDMEWDSPWGRGFPGWHIECSAMVFGYLGETIDIHTGGVDHIPVHHTNELAQSEAATGKPFSRFWLHNNFLLVDGRKISKSLNNGIALAEVEAKGFSLMDFKLFVHQSHYRTESNFSWDNLRAARNRRLAIQAFADLRWQSNLKATTMAGEAFENTLEEIRSALEDDMNTPKALAALSGFTDEITGINPANINDLHKFIEALDALLGMRLLDSTDITEAQKAQLTARETTRQNQDWVKSDELRNSLAEQGIDIKDTETGSVWSRN